MYRKRLGLRPSLLVFSMHVVSLLASLTSPARLQARERWQHDQLPYRRHVTLRATELRDHQTVICEFLPHGAWDAGQASVAVYAGNQRVPDRILQVGPADFCRLAFQPLSGSTTYQVYYGPADKPTTGPEWTSQAGLLLETRHWKASQMQELGQVQKAFESAASFGCDLVSQVFHRHNPLDVQVRPFLSRYTGRLRVTQSGPHRFYTSSQDCSFLLIDGQLVVAAPGRHAPERQGRIFGDLDLTPGFYRFEYWHAAAGSQSCAVAAWKKPGADSPVVIGPEEFDSDRVIRVAARHPEHRTDGPLPDMRVVMAGELPIDESDQWMVRVQLQGDMLPAGTGGRWEWDFGDGQTSDQRNPTHIFLRPGEYPITLQHRRFGKTISTRNNIWITRPIQHSGQTKEADPWDMYAPIIDTYAADQLDAESLLQLVRLRIEHQQYRQALTAGMHALDAKSTEAEDQLRWQLASVLDPIARIHLQDSRAAFDLWNQAGKSIHRQPWRACCAVAAADIALNELLRTAGVEAFLQYADRHLKQPDLPGTRKLHRVWGDWFARQNKKADALAAYRKADGQNTTNQHAVQRTAQRGAFSRSAEAYLREKQLVQARTELDAWLAAFPSDKTTGYLSMLFARYWLLGQQPQIALVAAQDLLTVNPQSPYADRLLMIQAEAHQQAGQTDRALATYQALLSDYPGSPLVDEARQKLKTAAAEPDRDAAPSP